jgi:multisubunit Na+/H+ antiporter MnhB subunit
VKETFDAVLAGLILWLAWSALRGPDLFRSIVLFIALGLLMGLAWARLRAPDIALAEMAVGAGVTGALLLVARARVEGGVAHREPKGPGLLAGLLCAALFAALAWAVLGLPEGEGLRPLVAERLPDSGVSNPVTAVLLNFRAYDTLLELAVLLAAATTVWSLAKAAAPPPAGPPGPLLGAFPALLVPVMVLGAGYFLWRGSAHPGGAFQAGAVLGGAGVLWILLKGTASRAFMNRPLLAAGTLVFSAVGLGAAAAGGRFLEYPAGWSGALILVIEAAAALSIGSVLAVMFAGGRPRRDPT